MNDDMWTKFHKCHEFKTRFKILNLESKNRTLLEC